MAKKFDVSQTANILIWWFNYISAIGRNYVLNEGTIKYPFAEYLECLEVDDIQFEFPHPKLSRRRFDLSFTDRNNNNRVVFEFKYIKNLSTKSSDEKQRIFNDLMRINLFSGSNRVGYFLICGEQMDFVSGFQRIKKPDKKIPTRTLGASPKPKSAEGFYTEWFSFDKGHRKHRHPLIKNKNRNNKHRHP